MMGPELYYLKEDAGERVEVADFYPDKVEELKLAIEEWESGLVDPLWVTDEGKQTTGPDAIRKKVKRLPHEKPQRVE